LALRSKHFPIAISNTASVANLKTASSLTLDDDLAMPRAQFDLPNVSASSIDFFGDQSRALETACIWFGLPFGTAFDKLQSSISV
jgi:hypothetical protein